MTSRQERDVSRGKMYGYLAKHILSKHGNQIVTIGKKVGKESGQSRNCKMCNATKGACLKTRLPPCFKCDTVVCKNHAHSIGKFAILQCENCELKSLPAACDNLLL